MDFRPGKPYSASGNIPMPFYMAYPEYMGMGREQDILKDMEYLQQTYPVRVRMYQKKITEILDKLDYEGSMIYDEYPDKYQLQRLAKTILEMLKQEESWKQEETPEPAAKEREERWLSLEQLLYVLVCDEIYKRRHGSRYGGKVDRISFLSLLGVYR